MLTLFHHPFCPHSRFIRLLLAESGIEVRLVEERVWDRREEFLMMNPAGTTPVLVEEGYLRKLPTDPITQGTDWTTVFSEPDPDNPNETPGVYDVKSSSEAPSQSGTPYNEW